MKKFAEAEGLPVFAVEPKRPPADGLPGLYLSAGIHGDEPASTEALLTWADRRARALARVRFLIFPCLNPWGLFNNTRRNEAGIDLNRGYLRGDVPVIAAQKAVVAGRTFDAAMMLHEDFDAHGIYLYELPNKRPFWGEKLLAAGSKHVPCEPRARVEGRPCRGGLIRPRITPGEMLEHPEAFFVAFGPSQRSLTFETPSEFSLTARVCAHGAVLDELLRLVMRG